MGPASAQDHEDQIREADGDDATPGTEQQHTLKSCHRILPRQAYECPVRTLKACKPANFLKSVKDRSGSRSGLTLGSDRDYCLKMSRL
jgi:hypothetical protein